VVGEEEEIEQISRKISYEESGMEMSEQVLCSHWMFTDLADRRFRSLMMGLPL
jgi:hypothetical protein